MKTPNKLLIANLRQNKKRTLATLIAIILSSTLLFAVSIAFSSYKQNSINNTIAKTGSYHVMYYDQVYQDALTYFQNNKKIKDIYILQKIDAIASDIGEIEVVAYSDELNSEITISNGRLPEKDTEIVLSKEVLTDLDLKINSTIGKYTIVGIYKNYIKDTLIKGSGYVDNEIIKTAITKADIDTQNEHSNFYITYNNIYDTYDNINDDIKTLNISSTGTIYVQPNRDFLKEYGVGEDDANYAMLYTIMAITLYILSVFSMLIVYNAFSISLTERKKQFGILRSLGMSKRGIIILIIKEIFILSLISFPISFLLGTGIIKIGLIIINKIKESNIPLCLESKSLLIATLFILFTMLVSAYTPGRKASKTSPIEAIKSSKDYKIKKSNRQYKLIKKIFGEEGQIAIKNIRRNKNRFGTVITSLTISVILFTTMSTITSMFSMNEKQSVSYGTSIEINASSTNSSILTNYIRDIKSIADFEDFITLKYHFANILVDKIYLTQDYLSLISSDEDSYKTYFTLYGFDNVTYDAYKKKLNITYDNPILYDLNYNNIYDDKTGEITDVISYKEFKDNPTFHLCSFTETEICDIELSNFNVTDILPDKFSKENEINKVSIIDSVIIMSMNQLEELVRSYPDYFYQDTTMSGKPLDKIEIYINSENYKIIDEDIKLINDKYNIEATSDFSYNYFNNALSNHESHIYTFILNMSIYAIVIFIGIISISGMLNSINTNLYLRRTEFSMLRSMGMSKKSLNKMLSLENIFIITRALITGLVIFIILYLGFNLMINYNWGTGEMIADKFTFLIPFPYINIIIVIIVVILTIVLATSFSLNKIKKQNIIEAIRKESI